VVPTFSLGDASSYAILFEGGGSNILHIANSTTNTTGSGAGQGGGIGNIGVGESGEVQVTGGGAAVNGNVDFAASNTGQFSGTSPSGTVNYNVAAVTNALNTVNALNTTLGGLPGTNVAINGNTTINASNGTFSASGTGYTNVRVFTVTSFSLGHGQDLTINGDANGDSVVLNFTSDTNFNGNVVLTGGLTPDNVLFNFVGGPSLSFNNGAGASNLSQGIFLDPNGPVSSNNSNIVGRLFGGDSANFQFNGGSNITAPASGATPTLTTTPSPTTVTLGTNSVTLTDSATLSGGNSPTGTITFLLFHNGDTTPVHTEVVNVNGNGTYTTPTGFTLPTTGTVTGTYEWDARYSGDANNNAFSDFDDSDEQVTVSAASPAISTTPSPSTAMLGATLQDVADLTGGYHPTGSITFRLYAPGVNPTVGPATYTENVTGVNGNGTYHTTVGFASNATGIWHWVATYNGDSNNSSVLTGPLDEPVTIAQQADLALTKTVNDATPNVGDTVIFTVTLANHGPDPATGVQVTDLLPAGLTLVSVTPSQGSYSSGTGVWTVGAVATAAAPTLQIQATVVSPNAQTNTATISHADQFDPNPGNNSAAATVTPQQADLVVSKAVSDPNPMANEVITYTFRVFNAGPDDATNVQLTDTFPAGVTVISGSTPNGTYNNGVWDIGTLANGTFATLTITATVTAAGVLSNSVTVTHADQFDPNLANNTGITSVEPQSADVAIGKSVSDPRPNVGETITYTLTVFNTGPDDATTVSVSDPLPAGLRFVSADQPTYDPGTGTWTVGTVAAGGTALLHIRAVVTDAAVKTNTATLSNPDQFDPDPGNNTDSAVVTPQQADLAVTKSVDDAKPNVGDLVHFVIAVNNAGPDTATGVTVQDTLPAGLTFVSATPSQGTYDAGSGLWTVGTVGTSFAQTLEITARVTGAAAATNVASISHADQFDPNPGNNSAASTVKPQQADLALAKTVSNSRPNVGDTVTFTVTLTNAGPDPATGVSVSDTLPAGLTFVLAMPSQGTYDAVSGTWTVGEVIPAVQPTLRVEATVASPNAATNVASVSHADQFDPNTANNSASAVVTPQQADLALTKTVNNAHPNVGETVTFTVTLSNNGPDSATGVSVSDTLPAGLTFVSATPSQGSYDSSSGVWTIGTVTTATPLTLTITATVTSAAALTNTATITHADQFDPDTSNNSASITETPRQRADLALTKQVSPTVAINGFNVTYTFIIHNSGPQAATNVTVTDPFPAGLTLVGPNTPSQGSFNPATGTWRVGTLAAGATATLTVTARITAPGPISNNAQAASDQIDPDLSNNTSSASVTGLRSPDQISKRFFLSGGVNLTPTAPPPAPAAAAATAQTQADAPAAQAAPLLPAPAPANATAPAAATATPDSTVSTAATNVAAPAINSSGTLPGLLSGGDGGNPSAPPDGAPEGAAPTVRSDPPADKLSIGPAESAAEPVDVPTLDGCLAEWDWAAATAAALPESWFYDDVQIVPAVEPARRSAAGEGANRSAREELSVLAVAALLSSAAPQLTASRERQRPEYAPPVADAPGSPAS
jgi:uncharacterized repeat protein (TIGR01451 family)